MFRVIILNLKGGLGNQMFQYALGYILSKTKKVPLYFDLRLLEEEKINKEKTCFAKYDQGGKGKLDENDLIAFAKGEYGFDLPSQDAKKIIKQLGKNGIPIEKFKTCRSRVGAVHSSHRHKAKQSVELDQKKDELKKLTAQVDARYLFGAPMQGAKVEWSTWRTAEWFRPSAWEGWSFGPEYRWWEDEDEGGGDGGLSPGAPTEETEEPLPGGDATAKSSQDAREEYMH